MSFNDSQTHGTLHFLKAYHSHYPLTPRPPRILLFDPPQPPQEGNYSLGELHNFELSQKQTISEEGDLRSLSSEVRSAEG